MPALVDLTDQRFGRLLVIRRDQNIGPHAAWLCRCDCGAEKRIIGASLRHGSSQSCGCSSDQMRAAALITHGHAKYGERNPVYNIWIAMKGRCHNPTDPAFAYYGGRGIYVCDLWRQSFQAFLDYMGPRPDGMTVDRIDNNLGYQPGNCRWADRVTQQNNRRGVRLLTLDNETHTMSQWSRMLGGRPDMVRDRLRCGWDVRRALTTPP
jgi:hypothetical protein